MSYTPGCFEIVFGKCSEIPIRLVVGGVRIQHGSVTSKESGWEKAPASLSESAPLKANHEPFLGFLMPIIAVPRTSRMEATGALYHDSPRNGPPMAKTQRGNATVASTAWM